MKRKDVPEKYRWHLNDIFASDEAFETAFGEVLALIPELSAYEGKLGDRDSALACLKLDSEITRKFGLLYVYSHMLSHEDLAESKGVGFAGQIGRAHV